MSDVCPGPSTWGLEPPWAVWLCFGSRCWEVLSAWRWGLSSWVRPPWLSCGLHILSLHILVVNLLSKTHVFDGRPFKNRKVLGTGKTARVVINFGCESSQCGDVNLNVFCVS